jgi:hypothetical protein
LYPIDTFILVESKAQLPNLNTQDFESNGELDISKGHELVNNTGGETVTVPFAATVA